jgi:hypothetical protein
MAYVTFTTGQVALFRLYLGYPNLFRFLNPRLESAINVVDADPDASSMAIGLLAKIAGIETELGNRLPEIGLAKADEVAWFEGARKNGTAGLDGVRSEGRRFCTQLSTIFGVPLVADVFGERGYPGDDWMGPERQYGRGGVTPMG